MLTPVSSTKPLPHLFIFVALACEARALVKHWQLKKLRQEPYLVFGDQTKVIVVTGIGKIAMASAVAHTMALFPVAQPIMLNIGIAGHQSYPLGNVYLAHKIINAETNKSFYPQLVGVKFKSTATLLTVAKAQSHYESDFLIDMEAAGFYETASKFSANELIQSLKVVSDNVESSIANISENLVNEWLAAQQATIEKLLLQLNELRNLLPLVNDQILANLLQRFHFTASSENQLKKLLQNWSVLHHGQPFDWQNNSLTSSKDVLTHLDNALAKTAFYL